MLGSLKTFRFQPSLNFMKTITILRAVGAILGSASLLVSAAFAGDQDISKEVHIVVDKAPHDTSRVWVHQNKEELKFAYHHDEDEGPVTFLGVETSPVTPALGKQLGLTSGMGLVVARVIGGTAAAEVLEKHDLLLKFDDQLLVSSNQLGVLVRAKAPGTKVKLTLMRGGVEQVVTAELAERKSTSVKIKHGHVPHPQAPGQGAEDMSDRGGLFSRDDVEGLFGSVRANKTGLFSKAANEHGPVMRMMKLSGGNVVFTDEEGTTKLISEDGMIELIVLDQNDAVVFKGPVVTEDQRKGLDPAVKARLEKVEALNSMTLDLDQDFEVEEDVHVAVPHASVSPLPARSSY